MGMYTELVLKCCLKNNLSDDVKNVLEFLFNQKDEPEQKPDHEFFNCNRWRQIGSSGSYYHCPFALSKMSEGYIFSRSDLKDYDREILEFIRWISPYIECETGDVIGWSWYELDKEPTLLRKQ